MKRIGIIGAMELEVEQLKEKMSIDRIVSKASMEFYTGTLNGVDVVMDVEVVGALQIKKRLPDDAVLVFVTAPSFDVIRKRLVHRGDVAPGLMEERLERARWECSQAVNYDYIVVNDDLTRASEELRAIMLAEKCKTMERIHLIKEELSCSTPQ